MKKVLLSLAAVTAIAAAAPAVAQPYGVAYGYNNHRNDRVSVNERETALARRIDTAFRRGELSPYEASRLMGQLRQIEAIEHRYRRTGRGLTANERIELNARLDRLQAQVRVEIRDDDRRYGYGYGAGYVNRW